MSRGKLGKIGYLRRFFTTLTISFTMIVNCMKAKLWHVTNEMTE